MALAEGVMYSALSFIYFIFLCVSYYISARKFLHAYFSFTAWSDWLTRRPRDLARDFKMAEKSRRVLT